MSYTLVIGNKRYSSWSLRGWLAAKLAAAASGEAVAETMVWLDRPESCCRTARPRACRC